MKRAIILCLLVSVALGSNAQSYRGNYSMGLRMDDDSYAKVPQLATQLTRGYRALPSSHSLKRFCPTPQSQGQYGTCTSWATAYAARTIAEAVKNNWTSQAIIDREAFSPPFIYKQIKLKDDVNCQFGSCIDEAMEILKTKGTPKYKAFHPMCTSSIPVELFTSAYDYRIDNYFRLFSVNDEASAKINKTKMALSEDCPVVIGMKCYDSFSDATDVWSGEKDTLRGGHAMCVVGYDDNKYGGAVLIMNSWGTRWGNGGFTWVRYSDYTSCTKYAYQMYVSKDAPQPRPQPAPVPKPANGGITFTWASATATKSSKYALKVLVDAPDMITNTRVLVNGSLSRGIVPVENDGHKYAINKMLTLSEGQNKITVEVTSGGKTARIEKTVVCTTIVEHTLSGSFYVQLATGEKMGVSRITGTGLPRFKADDSYISGTRYRVYIQNNEPAYVYVLSSDLTNKVGKVFPPADNISPALLYRSNYIAIPNEKYYMQMDNTIGTDYLCVLYSKEPIDINTVIARLNASSGDIYKRLSSVLGAEIVPSYNAGIEGASIAFKAKSSKKLVPLVLEVTHK